MKLLVQPEAGVAPIVTALNHAKKTIDIVIFRLDRQEITRALEAAVARGVTVRALIAHTNRGGEKTLRKLELRLLASGITVARTANDLVRYHGKMLVVDDRVLHVYGFNFTVLDIEKSRSFGVVTRHGQLVQEARKLFEADVARQPYSPGCERFIVSPENARDRLGAFIKGARRQLLIYDPNVSDDGMLRLIADRVAAGLDVRIIGKVEAKWKSGKAVGKVKVGAEKYPGKRLHIRAIMRDGSRAFLGSQSLRRLELDKRREIGVVVHDERAVRQMIGIFEQDWALTPAGKKQAKKAEKLEKKDGKESGRLMAAAP
jgi:cardiolipin synthase